MLTDLLSVRMELTRYSYFRITTMGKKDLSINQKSDIVKQGRLKTELARAFSCTRHLKCLILYYAEALQPRIF